MKASKALARACMLLHALAWPALAAAACGPLGSAATYPVYGSTSLTSSGTVSNGTSTYTISGSGLAVNQDSGAKLTPSPAPTFPPLSPAFPANASTTDIVGTTTSVSPGSYRTITVATTTSFAAGTYYINALTVANNATVNFGAGTYYIGTLTLNSNGFVNVSSGTVRLNIGTKVVVQDGNKLNFGGTPSALQTFFYPGTTATIHDSNNITGLLYAPDSTSSFAFHDRTTITGAILGTSVNLGTNDVITYSPATRAALSAVSTCPIGAVDHYELALASTGLACLPATATVTACSDNSSPCSNAATTLSGQTATLATSAGSLALTTLTFSGAGTASTTLNYPAASDGASATVTLSGETTSATNARQCCPNGSSCSAANSCSITFNTAGFIVAGSADGSAATVPTQTAGTASATYYLRAVQTNTTTMACQAALTGARNVSWAYQCNNPTACSASNLMTVTGSSAATVQRNNNGASLSYASVPMNFDANGNALFTFNFADVGQTTLWATTTVNSATLSGGSNAFVTRPAGFVVSAIAQTANPNTANPAAGSAAGAKFVKAGESFDATVTATTSSGAAAPNYGKETSPEGVLLTRTLVLPAGGANGTLANATIGGASFGNGVASVTNLSWDEVGIITLTPSIADANYLGTGNVTGTTTGNIGRFVPDHFAITQGTPAPACSNAFTYFGQDGFTTPFVLKAQNAANATTQNYTGSFALLGLTNWNNYAFAAAALPAGSTLAASATAPTGSWSSGSASVSARHQVSRPTALAGETSVVVKAAPVDSDGVTMTVAQVGAATPLRFGRLRLSNAFGSEKAALAMTVQAQYWGGNAWVANGADSCTVLPAAAVVRSGYLDNKGAASAAWSTSPGAITVSAGTGTLTLSAPSPTTTGSVDIALNLGATTTDQSCLSTHPASTGAALPWLRAQQGSCSAAWDRDPAARASFGIYAPETRKTLHVRDIF